MYQFKEMIMYKYLLLALLTTSYANASQTETDINVSFSMGESSSVNHNITLYNFSDALLKSAENCTPYKEDLVTNNKDLATLSLMGDINMSAPIEIKGWQQDKCQFEASYLYGGFGGVKYECSFPKEQLEELISAMKDRSTEPVTETFTIYSIAEYNGEKHKLPNQHTMTDSRFMVTWSKLNATYCETSDVELTEEEEDKIIDEALGFSEEFRSALQNCTPAKEEKAILFMVEKLEIIGQENNKCKLKYSDFELNLPMNITSQLTDFKGIYPLLENDEFSQYTGKPQTDYLLFATDECYKNKSYNFGTFSKSMGNVKITQETKVETADDNCVITMQNDLLVGDKTKKYGYSCNLNSQQAEMFVKPYANLIAQYGAKQEISATGEISFKSAETNDETDNVSQKLFEQFLQDGICVKDGQTQIIKDKTPVPQLKNKMTSKVAPAKYRKAKSQFKTWNIK